MLCGFVVLVNVFRTIFVTNIFPESLTNIFPESFHMCQTA